MRSIFQILSLIFFIVSCVQEPQQQSEQSGNDELFLLYDSFYKEFNSDTTNLDTLYYLSKQVKTLADSYKKTDNQKLSEIYKRCGEVLRVHCDDNCGSNNSPILCCKDSLSIIDCYVKAISIYQANNDTISVSYTDAISQLADVYDQLTKSTMALPLRQDYVRIVQNREGLSSDMTADAFMFLGNTYELNGDFKLANNFYQKELKIREGLNTGDLQIVKQRISDFQRKNNLAPHK